MTSSDPYMPSTEERPELWAKRHFDMWGVPQIVNHGITPEGHCTCARGAHCSPKSMGKHPAHGNGWQNNACESFEELSPFLEKLAYPNLGIVTGLPVRDGGRLVVADFDGADGLQTMKELMTLHKEDWPAGPIQCTGSGMFHFLFRSEEEFVGRTKILPGLDVRAAGNQIVAPPSLHKSGKRYAWVGGSWQLPIPPLPDWLAEIFRDATNKAARRMTALDPVQWLKSQAPSIEGADGSKRCMSVAATLVRRCGIRDLDRFIEIIGPWNARCEPPWSADELEHKFNSVMASFSSEATVKLDTDQRGQVILTRYALDRIVREDPKYEMSLTFNTLTKRINYRGNDINDEAITKAEVEICHRYHLRQLPKAALKCSMEAYAKDNAFHPVKRYLDMLRWDGTNRLSLVPPKYLESSHDIEDLYFKKWAISAVARVYEPGCKVDDALILKGPQGMRKTTFFQTLAGSEWFLDTPINLKDKDAFLQIQTWIVEWGELDIMHRSSVEQVKSFLSSQVDRFRPPYGGSVQDFPRTCVVVGTTNKESFLTDTTGDRRFWVINCSGKYVDLDMLATERDQLWAEAVALYQGGHKWFLSPEEKTLQNSLNSKFRVVDPIYDEAYEMIQKMELENMTAIHWYTLCMLIPQIKGTPNSTQSASIIRALQDRGYEKQEMTEPSGKVVHRWIRT